MNPYLQQINQLQQNPLTRNQIAGVPPQMPQRPQPQQQQALAPHHHQIYEMLRNTLMSLHQHGVPGMEKVLGALNQQHVNLVQPRMTQGQGTPPTMPRQGGM